MRRSGRRPYVVPDLGTSARTEYTEADLQQAIYFSQMSREERLRCAKKGWRNWYINRGRLPLHGDARVERQLSWRRVH